MRSLPAFTSIVAGLLAVARADLSEMDARFSKLPQAARVLDSRGMAAFQLSGPGGSAKVVPVDGQPFRDALQVRTETKPPTPYALQLHASITAAVRKGDALLAIVHARGLERARDTDEARTEIVFECAHAPFTKSVTFPIAVGPKWKKFYVPFVSDADYAAGEAQVLFRAGYDPQVIEFGGVQLLDYGTAVEVRDLPYTPATYRGREADAAWRKEAAARIEKIRKGDLTIIVQNQAREPVPGAEVTVKMVRHAFGFGSAVDARELLASDADADKYREAILANFNKAVIENHLKWHVWEHDRETGPAAVQWLRDHLIAVRGHCLVWPGKKNLPQSAIALFDQPEKLRQTVLGHIADEVSAFQGQLAEWDVLNEPFSNTDLQKILGDDAMAEWFRAARAAEPPPFGGAIDQLWFGRRPGETQWPHQPLLFINDYSILESGGRDAVHQDHYFKTIRFLLDHHAPIEGIGIQGHFNEDLTPIPRLAEILDRFGVFKLPIQITEFDINTDDEQLQADYTRDFLTLMFSHPSVSGVLAWGFWERRHWIPQAAFFRADWSPRPAWEAWKNLVSKEWWTASASGKTDAQGAFRMRGFSGDYEVEWKFGDTARKETIRLNAPASAYTLYLP